MDSQALKIAGQIAGIGGLALGVFLLLFREIIRKNIFPNLTRKQAYRLLIAMIIMIWSIALLGVGAWVFVSARETSSEEQFEVTIRLLDVEESAARLSVRLAAQSETRTQPVNTNGEAYFKTLSRDLRGQSARVSVWRDGQHVVFSKDMALEPVLEISLGDANVPSIVRSFRFVIVFKGGEQTYAGIVELDVEGDHTLRTVASRVLEVGQMTGQIPQDASLDSLRPMAYEGSRWLDYDRSIAQMHGDEETIGLVSPRLVESDAESAILYRPYIELHLQDGQRR